MIAQDIRDYAVAICGGMRDNSLPYCGCMHVAGWETHNLHMVANILASFREHPGARVLVIVDVTHEPWLDGIPGMMPSVKLVDTKAVSGRLRVVSCG